jgi:alanine-synthesizing transaminase
MFPAVQNLHIVVREKIVEMQRKASFSSRTAWDVTESELARALRERREAGLPLLDLTASNPTQCGFAYDKAAILKALQDAKALVYDPDPRGIVSAREAVATYYVSHGAAISSEQIFLTTSTSEAYSYLFRLLADPGDEMLIAQPSYPLFDFLAQLDDVRLTPYPLFYDHGWQIDLESLKQRITPKTRAIALVHPNNPTGHFTGSDERRALESLCAEYGLALIVDEVFLDYGLTGSKAESFATGEHPALTFVLSGLSKIAALPQMKAAWIAAFGPDGEVQPALERLEVVADTFLSMNAPVQRALPTWLAGRQDIQRQIMARLTENLTMLDSALRARGMVSRLEVEAGWYVILRVPALAPDEELAVRLIQESGVSTHPGRFFGFPESGWLVLSLLTPTPEFCRGVEVILRTFSDLRG